MKEIKINNISYSFNNNLIPFMKNLSKTYEIQTSEEFTYDIIENANIILQNNIKTTECWNLNFNSIEDFIDEENFNILNKLVNPEFKYLKKIRSLFLKLGIIKMNFLITIFIRKYKQKNLGNLTNLDFNCTIEEKIPETMDPITYENITKYYLKCTNPIPHYFEAKNYEAFANANTVDYYFCPIDRTYKISSQVYTT